MTTKGKMFQVKPAVVLHVIRYAEKSSKIVRASTQPMKMKSQVMDLRELHQLQLCGQKDLVDSSEKLPPVN